MTLHRHACAPKSKLTNQCAPKSKLASPWKLPGMSLMLIFEVIGDPYWSEVSVGKTSVGYLM